jgi:hypothetical protein
MKIKIIYVFILFFLFALILPEKINSDEPAVIHDTFTDWDDLRKKQEEAGIDALTYLDLTFNFQVQIPNWLHLRETGSDLALGGTLPAVEGIENAILIKMFYKDNFETFRDFKKYIVEDLIFLQTPPWSSSHIFYGKQELGKYKNIGDAYKVYWIFNNLIYHCKYILIETKTSYLWIDFTSTQETFDKNIDKFDEFMNGFEITNF